MDFISQLSKCFLLIAPYIKIISTKTGLNENQICEIKFTSAQSIYWEKDFRPTFSENSKFKKYVFNFCLRLRLFFNQGWEMLPRLMLIL